MRIFFIALFLVISNTVFAQYVDNGSWYVSLINASASSTYKSYLNEHDAKTNRLGIVLGYLVNPQKKAGINSPIQIGAELGMVGWGKENVPSYLSTTFESKFKSYWINAVGRYRPVLAASKINPFFDIFAGPEFLQTKIIEYVSDSETSKVFGKTVLTKNYGFGAGAGLKNVKKNGDLRYIDLGIYYRNSEKAKVITRNSLYLSQDNSIFYDESIVKATSWQIRLGLTGFL